ncbi:hypothetical protein ACF0H5_021836 [Mactra antiquata]
MDMYSGRFSRHIGRQSRLFCHPCVTVLFNYSKRKKVPIIICCLIIISILYVSGFHQERISVPIVSNDSYFLFEPEVTSDFPTSGKEIPIIPHIIHQSYKREFVPHVYSRLVKSFVDLNPKWQYYFWTERSAKRLLMDKYPHLLPVWNKLKDPISRADVLRYVVLYQYGGVYVDLDFECLRPLDRVTYKYSCIIPTEPFEHAILRSNQSLVVNNGIMMSRPKHPFFKQLLNNLIYYKPQKKNHYGGGAMFATSQFLIYNILNETFCHETMSEPYSMSQIINKANIRETHENATYIPNTQYFTDTRGYADSSLYEKCRHFEKLSFVRKRACISLMKVGSSSEFSFTRRNFLTHNKTPRFLKQFVRWLYKDVQNPDVNIFYLAPRTRIYFYNLI